MEFYPVSREVNSPAVDKPGNIGPDAGTVASAGAGGAGAWGLGKGFGMKIRQRPFDKLRVTAWAGDGRTVAERLDCHGSTACGFAADDSGVLAASAAFGSIGFGSVRLGSEDSVALGPASIAEKPRETR